MIADKVETAYRNSLRRQLNIILDIQRDYLVFANSLPEDSERRTLYLQAKADLNDVVHDLYREIEEPMPESKRTFYQVQSQLEEHENKP